MIKFHIKRAQDRMKKYTYLKRSEKEFYVGMWVYLKLQPHRQVGAVAYKLELPGSSQVHLVFHVSQLKLCRGSTLKMGILPHRGADGLL
ncbi:hypothetical protein Tco_0197592 [Tanacetum coccineum]